MRLVNKLLPLALVAAFSSAAQAVTASQLPPITRMRRSLARGPAGFSDSLAAIRRC